MKSSGTAAFVVSGISLLALPPSASPPCWGFLGGLLAGTDLPAGLSCPCRAALLQACASQASGAQAAQVTGRVSLLCPAGILPRSSLHQDLRGKSVNNRDLRGQISEAQRGVSGNVDRVPNVNATSAALPA